MRSFFVAAFITANALGPASTVPTEPFSLTDEFKADYAASTECGLKSSRDEVVKMGEKAVYAVSNGAVTVLLDEYARRYALDYCWK